MARVVHFEVHADDPERAIGFYERVLGWSFSKWGEQAYWTISTGPDDEPGIDGGLTPRRTPAGAAGIGAYVCTVDVRSVDETATLAQASGGAIAVPKMAVEGVGWLIYCTDTEGNLFGMMQRDAGAK